MQQLEYIFNSISNDNPELPTLICFYRSVQKARPHEHIVMEGFNKLVEKKDYSKRDIESIEQWLLSARNITKK